MNELTDLAKLESRAWKSTFEDGLWDIYLGLILLNLPMGNLIARTGMETLPTVLMTFTYMMVIFVLFRIAKRNITIPRLGTVNFGKERQARRSRLTIVLALSVMLTVSLVILTIQAGRAPDGLRSLASLDAWFPLIVGLVVAIPMFAIAYFNQFPRGYSIAALFSLSIMAYEFVQAQWVFVLASALIVIPGIVLLVRFLNDHPLPVHQDSHG